MTPKIRFIVSTFTAKAQGIDYNYAHVLSTVTGRYLFVQHVGGPESMSKKVKEFLEAAGQPHEYPAVYSVFHEIGIREWNRSRPTPGLTGLYMSQVSPEVIFELEQML